MTNQYIVFRFNKNDIDENKDFSKAEVLYVLSGELRHIDDNKITIDNINIFDHIKNTLTDSVDLQDKKYYYVIIDSEKTNDTATIYIFESMKITENDITTSNKILNKTMKEFFGESNIITVSNTIIEIIKDLNEQRNIAKDYYTDFYKSKKQVSIVAGGGPTDTNKNNSNENITNEGVKNLFNTYYNTVQEISNIPLLKKLTSLNEDSLESIGINDLKDFIENILYLSEIDFSPFFNSNNSEHKKSLLFLFGMDLSDTNNSITINDKFLKDKLPDPVDNEDYKFRIKRIPFATMLYQLNDNEYIDKQKYENKSLQFLIHFLQNIINDDITILKSILDRYNEDIHQKKDNKIEINRAIRQKMKNNILTFLKFRNDDHNEKTDNNTYNRRFDIEIGGTQSSSTGGDDNQEKLKKILKIGYNNDNVKYYGTNASKGDANGNGIYEEFGKGNLVLKKDSQYPYNYLFGEFTQIFTPDLTNQKVAEKMNILVENYMSDKPKPVFIIGYGASGAGKTSSLIYFNKGKDEDERNGILVQLCNQLGADGSYTHIEVQYREFYDSGEDKTGKDRRFTR